MVLFACKNTMFFRNGQEIVQKSRVDDVFMTDDIVMMHDFLSNTTTAAAS